jgi:hypothetical protein
MNNCPPKIGDATVIEWAFVDETVRATGNTVHRINGPVLGTVPGLAICQYEHDNAFYLIYCSEQWDPYTDTWHQSIEDAKAQAEFEYEGIDSHWRKRDNLA